MFGLGIVIGWDWYVFDGWVVVYLLVYIVFMGYVLVWMWDVIIIGVGYNGLVCGVYLVCVGKCVLILECWVMVGGVVVIEIFYFGFCNLVVLYMVLLL